MVQEDGRPVIVDFNVARIRESSALTITGTVSSTFQGTQGYLAPGSWNRTHLPCFVFSFHSSFFLLTEVLFGNDSSGALSPARDLYAFGAMMYYAYARNSGSPSEIFYDSASRRVMYQELPSSVNAPHLSDLLKHLVCSVSSSHHSLMLRNEMLHQLTPDPSTRLNARDALCHPYFQSNRLQLNQAVTQLELREVHVNQFFNAIAASRAWAEPTV